MMQKILNADSPYKRHFPLIPVYGQYIRQLPDRQLHRLFAFINWQ